jgi:hypothetical protein
MKKFALALVVGFLPTTMAFGQQPAERLAPEPPSARDTGRMISPGETQEMWFYEQERRRSEDPQAIVIANAQQRAAERHARLAAMAWFGMSNSRPQCNPDPVHGPYSAHWVSNGYQPAEWVGVGGTTTVILQADRGTSRY